MTHLILGSAGQIGSHLSNYLLKRGEKILSMDIESVNYGRGVGYEIIEHIPPTDIKEISATKIRQELREQGKL